MNRDLKNTISWVSLLFAELSVEQLYAILHLRNKVFIVEQTDIYLDVDYKDQQAYHLMGYVDERLVAYCRIILPQSGEGSVKIGRVAVDGNYRKCSLGRLLMQMAISVVDEELKVSSIYISAQLYLQCFYESLGFVSQGKSYMDGTIEHIDMVREKR